jgi:hypothetical protein
MAKTVDTPTTTVCPSPAVQWAGRGTRGPRTKARGRNSTPNGRTAARPHRRQSADSTDLSDDEVEELRRLAKEMVCPYARNNKCHFSEDECVYGHQCPRMDECKL